MSDITLYMAPGTCARVTAISLEELGLDFDIKVIRFMKGEHKSPEYLAVNPKGKVPALNHFGKVITENVAIQTFLNEKYGGKLLPEMNTAEARAEILADLCFCSATLHPNVTRIRMPQFFAGEEHAPTVKAVACKSMDEPFSLIEKKLTNQEWWYGDKWSAMDAYLFWVFWRVEGADYDVSRFPAFTQHARRMEQRESVIRAMARENDAQKQLEAEGLAFIPPKIDVLK